MRKNLNKILDIKDIIKHRIHHDAEISVIEYVDLCCDLVRVSVRLRVWFFLIDRIEFNGILSSAESTSRGYSPLI